MAEQMRPASPDKAPDPASSYERAKPGKEAGMGRLDADKSTPQAAPDQADKAISNRQDNPRQVNAQDAINQRGGPAPVQPDHSMKDEEPLGWDQAPQDIKDPRQQRHPRTEGTGTGGTP